MDPMVDEPAGNAQSALFRWLENSQGKAGAPPLHEPGMEFGAPNGWWGQRKPRPHPHEGIDVVFMPAGQLAFDVIEAGRVLAIIDDFLGR